MLTEVRSKTTKTRLPEVGGVWMHANYSNSVYLRIPTDNGARAHGREPGTDEFYSVCLRDGSVCRTGSHEGDIVILEPVGGTAQFQPKEL